MEVIAHDIAPILDLPPDAPALERLLVDLTHQLAATNDRLDDMTDELEMLRRVIEPRLLNRKEAARLAGCSTRTIQRHEDRGHLQRAPTKGGGAVYTYADVVRLKKMIK